MNSRTLFGFLLMVPSLLSAPTSLYADTNGANAPDISSAVGVLKSLYDIDVKVMSAPATDEPAPGFKAPDELLAEKKLITPELLHHIQSIGGLDFDIFLSAQDWSPTWTINFQDPKKIGAKYEVSVILKREKEQTKVTWTFVNRDGRWLVDDALYEEPGDKPFTLRSLSEGD